MLYGVMATLGARMREHCVWGHGDAAYGATGMLYMGPWGCSVWGHGDTGHRDVGGMIKENEMSCWLSEECS